MNDYGYGLWALVAVDTAVIPIFAASFYHPQSGGDWRAFGAFSAFIATAADRAIGAEQATSWLRTASRRVWLALSAIWAAVIGLLPHVLHHAGPLAGAALFAGATGSLLFGVLGLIVAIPFLRRMHRRFGTWRAPAIALVLFAAVFSLSTFVIGPKINDEGNGSTSAPGSSSPPTSSHEAHHE